MPRKQKVLHFYSVYTVAFASEEIKARVERGEDHVTQAEQLVTRSYYSGNSQAQAERGFGRAARAAMHDPLAYAVVMLRGSETLIRVRVERR